MFGSPKKDINPTFDLQNQQQMSSGLLRYRLAPSSLYGEVCENFVPVRPSSPETDSMFARFLSPDLREDDPEKSAEGRAEQSSDFSDPPPQMLFHSHPQPSVTDASNLIRQNSSPAGFFDSGYCLMRGRQISFSSRQSSLSQISEMGSEGMSSESPEESSNGRCFVPGFPVWEDSLLSDGLSGFKRAGDSVNLNISQHQNGEAKNHHIPALTHQFSLPKTSSEMSAIEKILQFQDSVPCKIRAKRGCATHPRSIAERVRRTRISERMRKLQELVPNMDKQTNTADMLDLAVDYIKDLQCQVKTLTDNRVACSCSATKETAYLNQIS